MKNIEINEFVKRQTPESDFSHFDGTWEELLKVVESAWSANFYRNGYRDGVILVNVCPDRFYTGVVELVEGDKLIGEYKSRREGEQPRQTIRVLRKGGKQRAKFVEIVLYRHDVLAENKENSADAAWEVISINAFPTICEPPIDPMTLMHNHFGSDGGTKTNLGDGEFVDLLKNSFLYWKNKGVMTNGG